MASRGTEPWDTGAEALIAHRPCQRRFFFFSESLTTWAWGSSRATAEQPGSSSEGCWRPGGEVRGLRDWEALVVSCAPPWVGASARHDRVTVVRALCHTQRILWWPPRRGGLCGK